MSENLSFECQRCGKRIKDGICNVHVVSMEHEWSQDTFMQGSFWLCVECQEKLYEFLLGGAE